MADDTRAWKVYWWLERHLAPGVHYAQADFEQCLFRTVQVGDSWLDVGCGHSLLPPWRESQERELLSRPTLVAGLDPELVALSAHRGITLRVCGEAGDLPFADGTFDLVTANMVVEHLSEPEVQFREVSRILRPGGRLLIHTPNAEGYPTLAARLVPDAARALAARMLETRPADDRFSTYYRANTLATISAVAAQTNFAVEQFDLLRSTAVFWRIPPLAALELLFLRLLDSARFARLRPNLITVLRKR